MLAGIQVGVVAISLYVILHINGFFHFDFRDAGEHAAGNIQKSWQALKPGDFNCMRGERHNNKIYYAGPDFNTYIARDCGS